MKDLSSIETLPIPEGVEIKLKSRVVTVTGPRGTLTKAVKHIQMDIQIVSERRRARIFPAQVASCISICPRTYIRIEKEGRTSSCEVQFPGND